MVRPSLEDGKAVDRWDALLAQQTEIYRTTVSENKELRDRLEDLERELGVWKAAVKAGEEKQKELETSVERVKQNLCALKEDNPLVLCIIDGDGTIFNTLYISQGHVGGRHVAATLKKGLTDYLSGVDPTLAGRAQISVTVYCNRSGLQDLLTTNQLCSSEQFEAFVLGFNQASPLFSIVDVGYGKEAADVKIKESLRVYARFPQIPKIFFGGGHDNGYNTTLTHLENEGLLEKIVLLKGYNTLAFELKRLDLPMVEIGDVFMPEKLTKRSSPMPPQTSDLLLFGTTSRTESIGSDSPSKSPKALDNSGNASSSRKKKPCTYYYLSECKSGDKCKYSHSHNFTTEKLAELKKDAAKTPCPAVNRNQPCGTSCIFAHTCPRGPQCTFLKQGRCKFNGKNMHSALPKGPSSTDNVVMLGSPLSPAFAQPTSPTLAMPLWSPQTHLQQLQDQVLSGFRM